MLAKRLTVALVKDNNFAVQLAAAAQQIILPRLYLNNQFCGTAFRTIVEQLC